mmetsp:Transcript_12757/g.17420  ORF Transcript_12757/g.17420 Transcript_12757/m.17420 type:complete len:162 (-) Transcript_12757:158-643(-)|eukprot:CAMPEP_0196578332 /NCGR_PEP_ID=MMETSP1081-20130531/7247_1 /TAXON_ID=36882 /ORGANISM="Pyramimonas amylifera, Strain CCMP720" /LENGTH=161 /DNA_ID=CAMNT_0041897521 /DNA_START=451 /DNA_END=936 /DNA_ORIENTATION=+
MDFPSSAPVEVSEDKAAAMAQALGVAPIWVGLSPECNDYVAELGSVATVRSCQPNLTLLASLGGRGVAITARADNNLSYDFESRWFGPNVGVSEDPVTGSSFCALAPFWSTRFKKPTLQAYQCSARGGDVQVELDHERERIKIRGRAITVIEGNIIKPPPQ